MEKITKRMVIETMLTEEVIKGNDTYRAFLENELEILKRKSENRKPSANQEENVEIKKIILEVLETMGSGRATDIMVAVQKTDPQKYATLTNQRVSAILKQLKEENLVIKTIDKKVSTFSLAE